MSALIPLCTLVIFSLSCAPGSRKFFGKTQHFLDSDFKWNITLEIFLERAGLFARKLLKGLGRGYQSWILEGLVSFSVLLLGWPQLERSKKRLALLLLISFLSPFVFVFLTPFDNFAWHLDTTISRIGSAGLLGMIYLAFFEVDQLWCRRAS